jgi:predicted component of type VI protein secretion system
MASEVSIPLDLKPAPRGELTIVAGAHAGATFSLTEEMLLIGADADCDVWLSDPGLAARHAALLADDRGVAIRPLDGAVSVEGRAVKSVTRCVLTPGCEITLGDSGVRLRLGGKAPPPEPAKVEHRTQRKPIRTRAIMASTLVVAGIFAAGLAVQKLRPANAATSRHPAPAAATNDAELIEQLREVFRGSGYEIEATRLGGKRVRIENLDAKNPRVRRATEQARADIPQLSELTFASPDSAAPPAEPPFYEDEPAGHLRINVSGDTVYLSAPNGVRYFAGSVLPSGYTVRRITDRAIQVDRDGQISWLRL